MVTKITGWKLGDLWFLFLYVEHNDRIECSSYVKIRKTMQLVGGRLVCIVGN